MYLATKCWVEVKTRPEQIQWQRANLIENIYINLHAQRRRERGEREVWLAKKKSYRQRGADWDRPGQCSH